MATDTPDLTEFIDLEERRASDRKERQMMKHDATIGVYRMKHGQRSMTVRLSEDIVLNSKLGLKPGMKMRCMIHPDGTHIALKPGGKQGAVLFQRHKAKSLIYQTTISGEIMKEMSATPATVSEQNGTLVLTLESDSTHI